MCVCKKRADSEETEVYLLVKEATALSMNDSPVQFTPGGLTGETAIFRTICQAPCQSSCTRHNLPSSRGVNLTLRDVVAIN